MAESINRGVWVIGTNLFPGQVHHWVQDGQAWGRVRWFIAQAYPGPYFPTPFSKAIKVEEVFTRTRVQSTSDFNFRIEVIVRNVGDYTANYIIWFAESTGHHES